MATNKPTAYNNRLGIKGWVYAGKYTFERYLYIGHRLSGLGLIAYMTLHIIETANRMRGEQAWAGLMGLFASPLFKVIEYLLFAAAVFHATNGVRLLMVELGFFLGKPEEPVYPYKSSVMKHRPLTYIIMALAALLIILGGSSLFFE
ncbi:MAG TPA: succinate dehydrogenase, cytochrome b556 subunit [Anaerolineales bacterium]|nr:succinate dehydrogenase, cytochrome b556 subunit [Anaerolineales bacterium]HNN14955.1 succinate dehydrogenase, cytochrome b556 subunit [Anaerolineales bacterium]HNO30366.1 succinate dehydrogenase, cytochrome b556 subunit [Anaerolineales bacterium]